jgi:hypothetical protein
MKTTIVSKKYGSQVIDLESVKVSDFKTNSTVFKIVEYLFNEWFEYNTQSGAPLAKDIKGCFVDGEKMRLLYIVKGELLSKV